MKLFDAVAKNIRITFHIDVYQQADIDYECSRPRFIALPVQDSESKYTFYTDRLGLMRAKVRPPGAVLFDTHPVPLTLRDALVDLDATKLPGYGVALWLQIESSVPLLTEFETHSLKIVRPFEQGGPFGKTCTFQDSHGCLNTPHEVG